ncbi:hypothetical protein B0H63DRAFT_443147 [Podospora didyma]|uniref:Uncharacterized protein n=1 Tax=Podospora didyma TaxID=330526 RepID=A0AAE0P3Q8_9PEZI|nr:hypothetical protein B0H63DRAFT_443147 [Podospora didyma]
MSYSHELGAPYNAELFFTVPQPSQPLVRFPLPALDKDLLPMMKDRWALRPLLRLLRTYEASGRAPNQLKNGSMDPAPTVPDTICLDGGAVISIFQHKNAFTRMEKIPPSKSFYIFDGTCTGPGNVPLKVQGIGRVSLGLIARGPEMALTFVCIPALFVPTAKYSRVSLSSLEEDALMDGGNYLLANLQGKWEVGGVSIERNNEEVGYAELSKSGNYFRLENTLPSGSKSGSASPTDSEEEHWP